MSPALPAAAANAPDTTGARSQDIAVGPTLAVFFPGIALRQWVSPTWGYQVGANLVFFPMLATAVSGGGQVMYSLYHRDGQRWYGLLGIGDMYGYLYGNNTSAPAPNSFAAGPGIGYSRDYGKGTFLVDLSLAISLTPPPSAFMPPLPVLQVGCLHVGPLPSGKSRGDQWLPPVA